MLWFINGTTIQALQQPSVSHDLSTATRFTHVDRWNWKWRNCLWF